MDYMEAFNQINKQQEEIKKDNTNLTDYSQVKNMFNNDPVNMFNSDVPRNVNSGYKFDIEYFLNLMGTINKKNVFERTMSDVYKQICFNEFIDNKDEFISLSNSPKEKDNFTFKMDYENKKHFSVSEILQCERQTLYKHFGFSPDSDYDNKYKYVLLMTEVGKFVHAFVQNIYPFTKTEFKLFDNDYNVSMRVDGIIDNTLIEIKTVKDVNKFDKKHLYQSALYFYFLNKNGYKIDDIEIVYICRDLKTFNVYKFNYNDELKNIIETLLNKIKRLHRVKNEYLNNHNILNELICDKSTCIFCEYRKNCNSLVNLPNMKKNDTFTFKF